MKPVPRYGPPQVDPRTEGGGEYPMRRLNAKVWAGVRELPDDPVKLGGCGRVCEGGSWVPVFDHDSRWLPGALATCDNAMLCDFCGPRRQAESVERWTWHFEDWLASGGQLVTVRLSVPHTAADGLAGLLAALKTAEGGLRRSAVWRRAGIVDWVRVLHVRWSPDTGYHPHYHVTGFVPGGVEVDVERVQVELAVEWRRRVARAGVRRRVGRHGVHARVVDTTVHALYAWGWVDDDDDEHDDGDDRYHPMADGDDGDDRYHPQRRGRGSMSLAGVAAAALDGDKRAWAVWMELCRALKGVPVVKCSRMLDRLWADRQAVVEPVPVVELGDPVVLVDAKLWERARRAGCTQMGLSVGCEFGVEALARWWARSLGVRVRLVGGVAPRLVLAGPSG